MLPFNKTILLPKLQRQPRHGLRTSPSGLYLGLVRVQIWTNTFSHPNSSHMDAWAGPLGVISWRTGYTFVVIFQRAG